MSYRLLRQAFLAGAGAALAVPCRHASAQGLPVVRLVGPPNDGFAPIYWAQSSGLFARYGIDVQTVPANNGSAALAAVLGAAADVAFTNIVAVYQAHVHNIPLQIVAPSVLYSSAKPQGVLLVLKDALFRTGHDMNGKTIGVPAVGDLAAASVMGWVDKTGGDSKSLRFVEVPSAAAQPILEQGRVDAAFVIEPVLTESLATGRTRVLCSPYDAIGDRFETTALVGAVNTVDQNRDKMSRFARAMHEANVYTNAHPSESVDLVAAHTGSTPDQVAHSARSMYATYLDPRYMTPLIDFSAKYGLIDHTFPAPEIISPVAMKLPGGRN